MCMMRCVSGNVGHCFCARDFAYNTLYELPIYKTNLQTELNPKTLVLFGGNFAASAAIQLAGTAV